MEMATIVTAPISQKANSRTGPRNTFARALATWFGCGLLPFAPGTCAAAAATLIGWVLHYSFGWGPLGFFSLVFVTIGPAVWASGVVARRRGAHDPDIVVVDEVIGQWVAFTGVAALDWSSALLAFVLFRLFDVWKPPPVRQVEKFAGGFGIVADDVMAGAYSALALYLVSRLSVVLQAGPP